MTYSGGQRGRVNPRSERESAIQSLVNTFFPSGTGRSPMDRRTASQKYKDAVSPKQIYGSLPTDYKQTEQTAGQIYGSLPIDYKTTEQQAGLEAEQFRKGAGFPGQTAQVYAVQPPVTPIVIGLTPTGEVDRRQSDDYKSTRARYEQLRKAAPEMVMTPEGLREKALDYGLQEWARLNPTLAKRQQSTNPLMQQTFDYQTGLAPDQIPGGMAPDQQIVMGDLGSRAQGEGGYDYGALMAEAAQREMKSPDLLEEQKLRQSLTAGQADRATTAGMNSSISKRVEDYLRGGYGDLRFPTQPLF